MVGSLLRAEGTPRSSSTGTTPKRLGQWKLDVFDAIKHEGVKRNA
jgi:hypothetical protein